MNDIKLKVEAILFSTGRFMGIEEISKAIGVASHGAIRDALSGLIKDYAERPTSLQIFQEDNKFMLNIKKSYNYLTTNLINESELERPVQETLAVIAYRQPMVQSDLIKIRGNSAYDHVKVLKEQNFIVSEKYGRTRLLKLTSKFFDYFDLVELEKLKQMFKHSESKVGFSLEGNPETNSIKERPLTDLAETNAEKKIEKDNKEDKSSDGSEKDVSENKGLMPEDSISF